MRVGPHGRPKPLGDPYRRHVVFWWQRREVGECLYHDAPLPQSLAALVGLFGIVACDVCRQCSTISSSKSVSSCAQVRNVVRKPCALSLDVAATAGDGE
jgi:hypothetical protein